jgi:GNAT superfamily N-acetyltransferase
MKIKVTYRALRAGDMGEIIAAQARLYWQEYRLNHEFEALLCQIAGRFLTRFDPAFEAAWVAVVGGKIVGSVFLVKASKAQAQLRMLYVDSRYRGHGIGQRLVDKCLRFARAKQYKSIKLWTNSVLHAARHIYVERGFVLVKEERHVSFGQRLVGQYWRLKFDD